MYVIKFRGLYVKFGSYHEVTLHADPWRASLYARENDARFRLTGRSYYRNRDAAMPKIYSKDLSLAVVTFSFTERPV